MCAVVYEILIEEKRMLVHIVNVRNIRIVKHKVPEPGVLSSSPSMYTNKCFIYELSLNQIMSCSIYDTMNNFILYTVTRAHTNDKFQLISNRHRTRKIYWEKMVRNGAIIYDYYVLNSTFTTFTILRNGNTDTHTFCCVFINSCA